MLSWAGGPETNSAQLVIYTVSYKNSSNDTIKNARLKLNYPNGFNYGSSEPKASIGGNVWNVGDLQQDAKVKLPCRVLWVQPAWGE